MKLRVSQDETCNMRKELQLLTSGGQALQSTAWVQLPKEAAAESFALSMQSFMCEAKLGDLLSFINLQSIFITVSY